MTEENHMMITKRSVAKGLSKLLVVPVLIAVLTLIIVLLLPSLESYGVTLLTVFFGVVAYPSFIYLAWLFSKVRYSDTEVLDKIVIYGAPEEVVNQLKTISKNRLVNVHIILFLGSINRKPIQSEIVRHLKKIRIALTATRIREILQDLEKLNLITSSKPTYERKYRLTKKGNWCFIVSKYHFPKRNGLFVLRNEILQKKFSPFPETN